MRYELGEIVYALNFCKSREVYLEEAMIIATTAHVEPWHSYDRKEELSRSIKSINLRLFPIDMDEDTGAYKFSSDEAMTYEHPEHLIFRNKDEAFLYLHSVFTLAVR